MGTRVAVTALAVLSIAACAGPSNVRPSGSDGLQVSVDGPVITSDEPRGEGRQAIVSGTLTFQGGCLRLRGMPVVWPHGTAWDERAEQVVLRDGSLARPGSRLDGGGGFDSQALRLVDSDKARALIRRCLGATREVAVFNAGPPVKVD
jgi:hypothetical protein